MESKGKKRGPAVSPPQARRRTGSCARAWYDRRPRSLTETHAIRQIKHTEFLAGLEETLDVCHDVGNALETIVIKNP